MKTSFHCQELAAVIAEAVTLAGLTAAGMPNEQAKFAAACIAGATKGLSRADSGPNEKIFQSIKNVSTFISDEAYTDLPHKTKDLILTNILHSKNLIDFMCKPDAKKHLKEAILLLCENDPECDPSTFPADEMVSDIITRYEQEVQENHELTSYACYKMIQNSMASSEIFTANDQYVKSFTDPLFLHKNKGATNVNLENLFILQKYKELGVTAKLPHANLQERLTMFLQKDPRPFLFVEGDAGCGKTSLVAWMNYHYSMGDEIGLCMFNTSPLITIRLRDLDRHCITKNGSLTAAICKYLKFDSLDELEQKFPNAVMLLDGFDELCMIEGLGHNHDSLLFDLYRSDLNGYKFIVTTRPKYINHGINIPSKMISLQHFDPEQRAEWLERYTSQSSCGQTIDDRIREYILNIEDDSTACICDTPMTLYMLAAKEGASNYLDNPWSLYHHIFYEELSETEYNKMFPNPLRRYTHDIGQLRDVLYRISEEIAYRMYIRSNSNFYLSDTELRNIITQLSQQVPILKEANMQNIAEHCYALCCYWKANSERGAVEFLHNNIRDFFMAEKIYRELDIILEEILLAGSDDKIELISHRFCSLFRYGVLETRVLEFLYLRVLYQRKLGYKDFAEYESRNKLIHRILIYLSDSGFYESGIFSNRLTANPIEVVTNILTCVVQIYRHLYEPYLKEKETIPWLMGKSILCSAFKPIFCQVPVTLTHDYHIHLGSRGSFEYIRLKAKDLRNIGFQGSNLTDADLSDSILCGCDLSNAVLTCSDLQNADLHYASLKGASLIGCNMTGADLRGSELPDGFVSINQDEQVEHLRQLGINGLKI